MIIQLDRICDQIEWTVGANEVRGRVKNRHREATCKVKIRLKGFHTAQRQQKLAEAQVSVALALIGKLYDDILLPAHEVHADVPADDNEGEKRGAGGSGAGRKGTRKKAKKTVRSGQSADGSDDR